jgi:hypothetical protein
VRSLWRKAALSSFIFFFFELELPLELPLDLEFEFELELPLELEWEEVGHVWKLWQKYKILFYR